VYLCKLKLQSALSVCTRWVRVITLLACPLKFFSEEAHALRTPLRKKVAGVIVHDTAAAAELIL
jgi:hypothetical protein